MKSHHIRLSNGSTAEVKADDIKFIGEHVYKVLGLKWVPIYKKREVRGIYVKS